MDSPVRMTVPPVSRSPTVLDSCQAVPPAVTLGGDCEPPKLSELAEKILMVQSRLSESLYRSPQSSHHHNWGEPSRLASVDAAVSEESLLPAADERMLRLQCEALARRNGELSDKVAELVGVIQNLQLVREPERALGSEVHTSASAAIRPDDRVPIGKMTRQNGEITKEMFAFETDRKRLSVTFAEDDQGTTTDNNNQNVSVGSSDAAVVALFDVLAERQCEQEAALQAMALEQAWFEGRMALMSEERGVILRLVRTYWVGVQGPESAQPKQRERISDAAGSSRRQLISSASNSDPPRDDSSVRVVRLKRNPMDLCR